MRKTVSSQRVVRALGAGLLATSLVVGMSTVASSAEDVATPTPTATTPATPSAKTQSDVAAAAQNDAEPWPGFPVTLETNFSRPYKAISSQANSDFSQLNDLERIIRGSYKDPRNGKIRPASVRRANTVFLSVSRMENSHRVGRELIRAAKMGVTVRVIHGKASQSKESRALQRALNSRSLRNAKFKICQKGKSLACLSGINGAIMHSKLLLVSSTFTRDNQPAKGVIWTGSANLGGPSGERTYNNGLTIYNDKKLWYQTRRLWDDMYAERNIANDYPKYVKKHSSRYGYGTAKSQDGYSRSYADYGMFYSNLANVTIYPTPIRATPSNGRDPVLNMLNRIVPDDQCRIRLQENRFKYRRIAVAHKLVQLADDGCKVSVVAFEDDLKVNRIAHCQLFIRVCRPILDVFKTSSRRIEVAWAKPHDKTILVEAKMTRNRLNPEEVAVDGTTYGNWPSSGIRTKMVQAGSAALTGSNLVASDEITTETTDPAVYEDYLQHWKAILSSREIHNYPY